MKLAPYMRTRDSSVDAFLCRETLPYAPDARYDPANIKASYEISFTRYIYKPKPLRTLERIRAGIGALKKDSAGRMDEIVKGIGS